MAGKLERKTPLDRPVKCDCRSAVEGSTRETLLTAAANCVPLGPWHVMFLGHGSVPSPMVKKNRLSTDCGTAAGYSGVARLRSLVVNLVTNLVSLKNGRTGL